MNKDLIAEISNWELAIMFVPVLLIGLVMWSWKIATKDYWLANFRMLAQLLIIGYLLIHIFKNNNLWLGIGLMSLMLLISAWISLRPIKNKNKRHYFDICLAISIGTGVSLTLIISLVLKPAPWYQAQLLIPLAGLLLGNTMNSISLCGERFLHELEQHQDKIKARNQAFNTAMIPQINSLLAVGLVALPGTMTGQIISGVDPDVAARYQIVIMAAILISSAISIIVYLYQRLRQL